MADSSPAVPCLFPLQHVQFFQFLVPASLAACLLSLLKRLVEVSKDCAYFRLFLTFPFLKHSSPQEMLLKAGGCEASCFAVWRKEIIPVSPNTSSFYGSWPSVSCVLITLFGIDKTCTLRTFRLMFPATVSFDTLFHIE